eukprot:234091_1
MGNGQPQSEPSKSSDDYLATYSQLINMGFPNTSSLDAANRFPHNINEAINYISQNVSNNNITSDQQQESKINRKIDNDDTKNDTSNVNEKETVILTNYVCDGNEITECVALQRIISVLKYYKSHNKQNKGNNNTALFKYLEDHKKYLINDYHHILEMHLNEDTINQNETNKQFELIYKQIIQHNNNLTCNINECEIYLRNNRERETDQIHSIDYD